MVANECIHDLDVLKFSRNITVLCFEVNRYFSEPKALDQLMGTAVYGCD
jgi:hypothetical protein